MAKAAEFAAKFPPPIREIDRSYNHIATILRKRGIATLQGKRWNAVMLARILGGAIGVRIEAELR